MKDNKVSKKAIDYICEWMETNASFGSLDLRELTISNSKLIDSTSIRLMEGLKNSNPCLRELDLSHNKISDRSCKILGDFCELAYFIVKVNLKWNQISSKGAIHLFEGLYKGKTCKNLDLSYNWLNRYQSEQMLEGLVRVINNSLVHLDLSNNNLSVLICAKFGEMIENNHTLYGLHMYGNSWYVDGFGFIRVGHQHRQYEYSKNSVIHPQTFTGFSTSMKLSPKNPLQFMPTTKCWVCEGWTENTFVIKPNKSITNIIEPLHIHFDYNFYQPELMEEQKDGSYRYTTMCPPGKVIYFFTLDKVSTFARDHLRQSNKIAKYIEDVEQYDEIKNYRVYKFNYRITHQKAVLDESYSSQLKTWIPRPALKKYVVPEVEEVRDPWEFETSVFAPYIQDTESIVNKWFEFDWEIIQKPKFDPGMKQLAKTSNRIYRRRKTSHGSIEKALLGGKRNLQVPKCYWHKLWLSAICNSIELLHRICKKYRSIIWQRYFNFSIRYTLSNDQQTISNDSSQPRAFLRPVPVLRDFDEVRTQEGFDLQRIRCQNQ